MSVLAGLELGGAALTPFDELRPGEGALGESVLGPSGLLRDLELRLGCGLDALPAAVRAAACADRMARLAPQGRFYSSSYAVDPLGTARAVLDLRDELVVAGWTGTAIPEGGAQLDALAELEALDGPLPPGDGERLRAIARAAEQAGYRVYDELWLAEPEALWAASWRRVFTALARSGTLVRLATSKLPGAAPDTDLGRVQAALSEMGRSPAPTLSGDGSFVLLTAETSWEAARAAAAVVTTFSAEQCVVIREREAPTLDHAFEVQGLRQQGRSSRTPWRAATQVLPLALELAFDPKDPYRVLELLTLPVGPFQGLAGHRLARALTESPGVRSPAWERAKGELRTTASGEGLIASIEEWLERPGADAIAGAPKEDLAATVERVRRWLVSRIASTPDDPTLFAAVRHTSTLKAALESDPRSILPLVDLRRLINSVLSSGAQLELAEEQAGRLDQVTTPGSLMLPRDVVVWWSFVADGGGRVPRRFRAQERAALARAGITLVDPRHLLSARANGWRRAIQSATKRVVLVVPCTSLSKPLELHPLWDEVAATAGIDSVTRVQLTVEAKDLLADLNTASLLPAPARAIIESAALPGGHVEWQLQDDERPSLEHFSASSLSAVLGCPLGWALGYGAGLRGGGHALPQRQKLNGMLGHRLVECLHVQKAFDLTDESELTARAEANLTELIEREGAVLLRPGMAFERAQLESQLVRSVLELWRILKAAGLRIQATEQQVEATYQGKTLRGRLDLLVTSSTGAPAILDLKWGYSGYRDLLLAGRALQLAFYGIVHRASSSQELPAVAYFSLSRGRLLALPSALWPDAGAGDAPGISDTWRAGERSLSAAERVISAGRLPVPGLRRSLPLLEAFGVPSSEHHAHYSQEPKDVCKHCRLDALCGRRWKEAS